LVASIVLLFDRTSSDNTSCSAIDSYVQVISSGNLSATVTSAQALFPPYTYYLEYTDLTKLDSSDDPCSPSGISTDISSKVVLLFESVGNCTSHLKVAVAEENGAVGVLLANNDVSGEVITIIDDESLSTTIPMRSIPLIDGTELSDELDSETVQVKFGCFDSEYPTHLCMLDTMGDGWFLDGDYQRQEATFNDHAVYKKEGYVWIVDDIYVFLHDANGDSDWYWAITSDPTFSDDEWIQAVCVDLDVSNPSECTSWNLTVSEINPDDLQSNSTLFESYPYLNVSEGLCTVSDDTLCMESTQSNLLGMGGTYHQFNDATPYWFREHTQCDTRPAWLLFHQGYFMVWDSFDDIDVAICRLDREYYSNRSSWDTMKFRPDLCSSWRTMVNTVIGGSYNYDRDDTFQITMNSSCTEDACTSTDAPDTICFSKSTNAYSFLEGEYDRTDSVGPIHGYPEYARTDSIFYEGDEVEVYMWYYGETSEDTNLQWWVMSSSSLEEAVAANGSVGVYSFCEANVDNPIDCAAGWRFYFVDNYAMDESFELNAGECEEVATEPPSYPEYLCIETADPVGRGDSDSSYLPANYFVGGYRINETGTALSGNVPHWVKPRNDNWRYHDIYLYLDGFYGWWQIGNAMHTFAYVNLLCFDSDGPSPLDCNLWYDLRFDPMPNMNVYECTEEDMLTLTPMTTDGGEEMNEKNGGKSVTTGIVVTVVLIAIGLCGAFIWWAKSRRDRDLQSWGVKPTKIDSAKNVELEGPVAVTQIEMDEPFSQQDHKRKQSSHQSSNTHTGAFDMSPLNVNDPTHLDPSIGDDHDDHDSHDEDYASDGNAATGDVLE